MSSEPAWTSLKGGGADPTPHRRPNRTQRIGMLTTLAFCLLFFQCISSGALPAFGLKKETSSPAKENYERKLRYAGEKISWKPCGDINERPLECSEIEVPMDQFNSSNNVGSNKTFSIPLIRLRSDNSSATNILLNPGGPGGSGVEFIYRKGKQLSEIVGDGFHLLSFDPRGINGSKPLASCYPTKEARRDLSGVRDVELVHDSPEVFAWTQNFVRTCRDTMDERGAYINTPQTAADMNSILDAVGQRGMVYWGFSYGTVLGQTYAQLFPERVERVIIDGVVNNFGWYGDFFDLEQFTDTENVLEGFFDECIKAGDNCTLTSLTKSKHDLRKQIFDFSDDLKKQPISVYVNNTMYGLLDYSSLWFNGIFPALYRPASWSDLASNIASLLQGNATDAWMAYGTRAAWQMEGDGNTFVSLNDGLTGPAYWPQDRQSLLKQIIPAANVSIFGDTSTAEYYQRQQWVIPRTHNFSQEESVTTAFPLLVLSTTYDPICPLISARTANAAFEGSRLIEVEGYGHCSIAVPSKCLARHVRAFLLNGTLPEEVETRCEVDGPYFEKPEEEKEVEMEMEEEGRILRAQRELARGWEWRVSRVGALPIPV